MRPDGAQVAAVRQPPVEGARHDLLLHRRAQQLQGLGLIAAEGGEGLVIFLEADN